jgi:hypothetical protein
VKNSGGLAGPQSQTGHFGEGKNIVPSVWILTANRRFSSVVVFGLAAFLMEIKILIITLRELETKCSE